SGRPLHRVHGTRLVHQSRPRRHRARPRMSPATHDFSNQKVKHLSLRDATVVASDFTNANLSGDVDGLVINGVEVAPLIRAELERLYPERQELFTRTREGMQRA